MKNIVYIATSIDGYIADINGGIEWLMQVPPPENEGFSFVELINSIDALVMGRKTFETVVGFGGDWPYNKKVYVWSSSIKNVPNYLVEKVEIIDGTVPEIINHLNKQGLYNLYIDGGKTIQSFLSENKIDEMIITTISILLGGGIKLFDVMPENIHFDIKIAQKLSDKMSQTHYIKN